MPNISDVIKEVKNNPGVRNWVKEQLAVAEKKDIIDASHDAKLLAVLLYAKADAIIYGEEAALLNLEKKGYKFACM